MTGATRAVGWLAVVLLVAAACGGSGGDDAGGGEAGEADDVRAVDFLGEEGSGIGAELAAAREESPDGLLPTDVALDLFASVYGEVPGGAARFDDVRAGDASLAIRAVGARWDELDEEARAAIQERLDPDGADVGNAVMLTHASAGVAAISPTGGGGDDPPEAELLALAERLEGELARHLGVTLEKPIEVQFVPDSTWVGEDEGTLADATPMLGTDVALENEWDTCRLRVNQDYEVTNTTLAHEIFHCLQYELTPLDVHFAVPAWIAEGSADWAAATVAGPDDTVRGHFAEWQVITKSLYVIDYAAVGYFWTIETMGIDPWDDIPRMLSSGNRGHDAHHPALDHEELASRLGTGAFLRSADGMPVDGIWDLTPAAVPDEFRTSTTVSESTPIDSRRDARALQKTPAAQINVDGDALDVKLVGEVGAVQEVGGMLETFEGGFEKRFCFEDGDARIVFLNLSAVDPGPIGVHASVPSDDEACEERTSECTIGSEVHTGGRDYEVVYPAPAWPVVPGSSPEDCFSISFALPGEVDPGAGAPWNGALNVHVSVGFTESTPPLYDCAHFGADPCVAHSSSLPGGSIDGYATWEPCLENRPQASYSWGGEIAFSAAPGIELPNGSGEVGVSGQAQFGAGGTSDDPAPGDCAGASTRAGNMLETVADAIVAIVDGIRVEPIEAPEGR